MDEGVGGERITSLDQPSRRYPAGRICTEPGCATRLSIYNEHEYCSVHERLNAPRTRGKKIA